MTTLERLQTLLAQHCAVPADTLSEDASLESLGVDSLGVIELVFDVEEAFGVQFEPDAASSLRTVGDVAAHIDQLLAARGNDAQVNGTDVVRAM
jgi:acyl carrier protein